jgi:UDP-glucose 4-epimerase
MSSVISGACVVVTGGAGFIGSHLVRQLLLDGASEVRVIDSFEFGTQANLPTDPRVKIVKSDLGAASAADLFPACAGAQVVFHLAAEKHNASLGNPAKMLNSNVQGTLNILEAAAHEGCKRFVFSSSLYAYGRINGTPFYESEVVKPTTVYGISKVTGESLVAMYSTRGIQTTILRYMFIYGPRQWANAGYKSVIVKNFERMLERRPPVIFGDGRQALDYLYVSDAVAATIRAATVSTNGEVYNVGSGVGQDVRSLTSTMATIAGWNGEFVSEPPDWTAGSCRVADVSKVHRDFGWKPSVSLEEGLQRTFDWMRGDRSNGN